jgi:hypothetical protein
MKGLIRELKPHKPAEIFLYVNGRSGEKSDIINGPDKKIKKTINIPTNTMVFMIFFLRRAAICAC